VAPLDKFNFDVPRETLERLTIFVELLKKWQNHFNLVSRGTIDNIWERHIADSLQLMSYLSNKGIAIADLGTGAGFPGMVLAISGYNNIELIEANGKKIGFLKEVARLTSTSVKLTNQRIEKCQLEDRQIFISRALAPLTDLLQYVSPFTNSETSCIFLKGVSADQEIRNAQEKWTFEYTKTQSIVESTSSIITLKNIRKKKES
jgi:16S rRNA (guanine527-N7)-methyltransferase